METDCADRIARWRQEYQDRGLTAADLAANPLDALRGWLRDAETAGLHEPNAMVLATNVGDLPSSRMVLLKGLDQRGVVFYTNYRSRKAHEIAANPACALLFPWHPLQRQVRVEGDAERVSDEESDAYFAVRPRAAQLGAWASPQSEVIASREELDERYQYQSDRYAPDRPVPRPPYWGGILVRPHTIEFWQGRSGRMHDRIRFQRLDGQAWTTERLAP